jgi:hypothetical protein
MINVFELPLDDELYRVSDPMTAQHNAYRYLGDTATLYKSTRKNKKYMLFNPETKKFVHFGSISNLDHTKTGDPEQQYRYLMRASNIKGKWRSDYYSPNNLAINILWL